MSETFVSFVNFVVNRKTTVEQEKVHSRLIKACTDIGASQLRIQSSEEEARTWPMKHF